MLKLMIGAGLALYCVSFGAQASTVSTDAAFEGESQQTFVAQAASSSAITIFEDVQFMTGTDGNVSKLGRLAAGNYSLTLTDFEFPAAFDELKVALTTATRVVSVLSLNGEVRTLTDMVQLAAAESYYLSVFGTTQSPSAFGLYGVKLAQYSPVPVPASALLLLSGLFAWGFTSLRQQRRA